MVAIVVIPAGLHFEVALAASLTSMSDILSDRTANATTVTHTISFTTGSTDLLKRVTFRFSTTQGGTTKPAGLVLSGATLGTVSNLGAGWTLNTSLATSGILYIELATAATVNASVAASVGLDAITNSAIDDCQSSNDVLQDICNVRITTFSDDGVTTVDTGDTTYTVTEDPSLIFKVEDVPSGQTHNGVTSNINSAATSVSFGYIGTQAVRYGTHKITITTNTPHGYKIYAQLFNVFSGVGYVNNDIDPFGATNATWTTPQNWSSPNGSSPNVSSGWFGANTSDTRVTGWSSGSGKFGPLGQTAQIIAQSSGPDRSGSTIYASYAIEVNQLQAADQYSTTLVYDVKPIF